MEGTLRLLKVFFGGRGTQVLDSDHLDSSDHCVTKLLQLICALVFSLLTGNYSITYTTEL